MSNEIKELQKVVMEAIGSVQEEVKGLKEGSAEAKTVQENFKSDIELKFDNLKAAHARRQEAESKSKRDERFEANFKSFNMNLVEDGKKELSREDVSKYTAAYNLAMQKGYDLCSDEQKTLLSGVRGSDGGFAVPPEYGTSIIDRKFDRHGIFDLISKKTISGNSYYDLVDDAAYDNDEYLNDLANETGEHEPDYKQVNLSPNPQVYTLQFSRSLVEDNMFNLESDVLAKMQRGSIRKSAAQVAVGNGQDRPKGLLTYIDDAVGGTEAYNRIEAVAGTSGGATWKDILEVLPSALGDGYQDAAKWAMNRSTFFKLLASKDASGQLSVMNQVNFFSGDGTSMSLMGREVAFEAAMSASTATGTNSIVYGDFSGYRFVERTGFSLIVNDITSGMNITYKLRRRNDGKLCQGRGLKALKLA